MQKQILAEFMSEHSNLAKGVLPNTCQGKATANRLWETLTNKLNASGPPLKDVKTWRKDEHERKRRREDSSRDHAVGASNRAGVAANKEHGDHAARNEKDQDRGESKKKNCEIADREREDRERDRERTRDVEVHICDLKLRHARPVKRYMVQMPKSLLPIQVADVQDLRQRYTLHYIPSDFFLANVKWPDTFTLDNPFSLKRPCNFHIMHDMGKSPAEQNTDLLEPADANYLYSAKVMLMSLPPIAEIYKKCFESDDAVHLTQIISFLMCVEGDVLSMAIGGPWSPSLDGENPDEDPSVLIRTAIRTCKALTGIDLSNCTQWYRFVELYYNRTEYKGMEKDDIVEAVVIYLPDVHSCLPSIEEWQTLTQFYKDAADANSNDDNDRTDDVEMTIESTLADDGAGGDSKEKLTDNEENFAENNEKDAEDQNGEEQEEEMEDPTVSVDDEPTHFSLLDLKTMKVQEIRDELLARNLPDEGVRNVVMARLAKALNMEKAEESKNKNKNKQQSKPQNTVAIKKTNESNKSDEDEQMDVDSDEIKKKNEKKGAAEDKVNGKEKLSKSPKGKKIAAKDKSEVDDKEEWADIIDFELSDIVILDEYDSSKITEETNLKEMTEKEKARLIRYHTLPSSPHIVVHPNRQAKEGKFDCAVMSLSVLLDHHPYDSEERVFEVTLFAELFNDMLMRDFGFNIFKEIYLHEVPANANNVCEIIEVKADNDDVQSNKSESRKRKISTSTSTANCKDCDIPANDKKMVVVKPQLLLSFVYFDTSHCDYIFHKHLEELFYVLGLNLSQSEIMNVLGKFEKLESFSAFYYRKLTDKEESLESTPAIEDIVDLPIDEHKRITAANNQYEAIFGRNPVYNQISAIEDDDESKEFISII